MTTLPIVLFLNRGATASRSQVVAEVCACVNQAVDRRRAVKYSQKQWYAICGIRPTSEGSASQSGVRISDIVDEGRVESVPVRASSVSVPGTSNLRVPLGKSRKKRNHSKPCEKGLRDCKSPSTISTTLCS